jgi:SAM-dependent methyltransferase
MSYQKFETLGLCRCCLGKSLRFFEVREMMYGSREQFKYQECMDCGSLQIANVPSDLGRHYRHDKYASWRELPAYLDKPMGAMSIWLRAKRAEYLISSNSIVGQIACRVFGYPDIPDSRIWDWLRDAGVTPKSSIFDFGCGTGDLLLYLRRSGFSRLVGFDKFSACRVDVKGLRLGAEIPHAGEKFDLVMAHHSLEHVENPAETLMLLADYIATGGTLLIRVPVSQTYAWRTYGSDWVQLDAPRHLFIPSRSGMEALASRCNLRVDKVVFDSTYFQFGGSERYRQNLPMFSDSREESDADRNRFTVEQLRAWEQQADVLNANSDGDQACFFMKAA